MAGGHSSNRYPRANGTEIDFYLKTSKATLFEMLRAYAAFDQRFESYEDATGPDAPWIGAARDKHEDGK